MKDNPEKETQTDDAASVGCNDLLDGFSGSVFLENLHHAYAQTDGTYNYPNSREGDMLKQSHKEILSLINILLCEEKTKKELIQQWGERADKERRRAERYYGTDCAKKSIATAFALESATIELEETISSNV